MAQITIQDILGSDNVGASRAVMMSNFRVLADAVNRMNGFLNTSASNGDLTIGSAFIQGPTNTPISADILRVSASARIAGNLRVEQALTVGTGVNDGVSTFNSDLTIGRVLSTTRSQTDGKTNFAQFSSGIQINDVLLLNNAFAIPTFSGSGTLTPQDVLGFGQITTLGRNNIVLTWIDDPAPVALLANGYEGQVLVVQNKPVGTISASTLTIQGRDSGGVNYPIANISSSNMNANISNVIVTLLFVADNVSAPQIGTWKVLNFAAPSTDMTTVEVIAS